MSPSTRRSVVIIASTIGGFVLGVAFVLIVERMPTRRIHEGVLEERTPVRAEWIVFREPQNHGKPAMALSVAGNFTLIEYDRNGDGRVDKITLNLEGLPFLTISDSNFSGRFDEVRQVNQR